VTALRGPETGMIMARGRIGGAGAPFNIGDVTLTRASLRLADGRIGHAAHLGRDSEKARLAAIIDALWQDPDRRDEIEQRIVGPLETLVARHDRERNEQTAATRVDFFTMVRGED
ncbi:MAG: phosphonate C-P lyase system protein PhnG, partial [Rhizobiaceae bacterium]